MLDVYSSCELIRINFPGFIEKMLNQKELPNSVKHFISYYATHDQRLKLIKNHKDFDYNTKYCLCRYSEQDILLRIIEELQIDYELRHLIERFGNSEVIKKLNDKMNNRFRLSRTSKR